MWLDMYYIMKWFEMYVNATGSSYIENVPSYATTSGTYYTSLETYGSASDATATTADARFYNEVLVQTNTSSLSSSYYGNFLNFMVGTGTTPVTAKDYRMESQIKSGISLTATSNYDLTNGIIRRNATVTNTSADAITISELGIAVATSNGAVLIYREVLEEPIVLGAGESFTFTLTDTYPMTNGN